MAGVLSSNVNQQADWRHLYSASKLHSDIDKGDKNGNTSHYLDKCS